ncbi:TonB-dependent receptor [Paraglaciecola aestuariivivens]
MKINSSNKMHKLNPIFAAILATNLAYATPAFSQEQNVQQEEQTEDKKEDTLETITVTATKRDTSLMNTPIAISAFTEEQLSKIGIKNVQDLNNVIPNMSIMTDRESSAPIITMRGVRSTNTTEWGDPAVGVHYDGIYSPRPQGALSLMFDVERVEALRGPQGTLFGRNSTVGSLNIISAKPNLDEVEGKVEVEVGKDNQKAIKGVLNLPVSDSFALRFAVFKETKYSNLNGYYDPNQWDQRYLDFDSSELIPITEGVTPADRDSANRSFFNDILYQPIKADPADFYNNKDQYAFRVSGLYSPSAELSWLVTFERFVDQGAGGAAQKDCERILNRPLEYGGNCTDLWGSEDNNAVYVNIPGKVDMTLDSLRSSFNYDINDEIQFSYLAGYQSQERTGQVDLDQGMYFWDQMLKWVDTDYDSWSHELQLKSTDEGPLQWIVGYFNFKEDNFMAGQYHGAMGGVSWWMQPNRTIESEAVFAQGTYALTDKVFLTLGARYTEDEKEDKGGKNLGCWSNECYTDSAWGEVWGYIDWSRPLEDQVENTGAVRANLNALPADYYDYPIDGAEVDSVNDVKEGWSKTTWRVGLDYQKTENTLFYAYIANGYKGGGIGDVLIRQSDGTRFDTSYDGEEVITYEVGVKTSLFDNKMHLRANYFYSDYENQQFTAWTIYDTVTESVEDPRTGEMIEMTQDLGTFLTRNASNSEISGLELEMEFIPWEGGHIGGYLTFLDTKITSDYWKNWSIEPGQVFANPDGVEVPGVLDESRAWYRNLKGNQLAYSPEASLTFNFSHTFDLGENGRITTFANVHWEDDSYTSIDNTDKWQFEAGDLNEGIDLNIYSDKREAWAMVNANIRYETVDNQWYAEAGVYNLTDEDVNWWQGYAGSTPIAGKAERSWSLRVGYNF